MHTGLELLMRASNYIVLSAYKCSFCVIVCILILSQLCKLNEPQILLHTKERMQHQHTENAIMVAS